LNGSDEVGGEAVFEELQSRKLTSMKYNTFKNIAEKATARWNRLLIAGCICFLAACQDPASNNPTPATDTSMTAKAAMVHEPPDTTTLGGVWVLQPVLPSDTATGRVPFLHFDLAKSRFYGNSGCNNINGPFWFSDKDSSLSFSEKIISTRMACPGYNEQSFVKSLLHTSHYRLKRGLLIFLSDDNSELSRWVRKNAPARPGKV
jgi:heat shock protein HslJ